MFTTQTQFFSAAFRKLNSVDHVQLKKTLDLDLERNEVGGAPLFHKLDLDLSSIQPLCSVLQQNRREGSDI